MRSPAARVRPPRTAGPRSGSRARTWRVRRKAATGATARPAPRAARLHPALAPQVARLHPAPPLWIARLHPAPVLRAAGLPPTPPPRRAEQSYHAPPRRAGRNRAGSAVAPAAPQRLPPARCRFPPRQRAPAPAPASRAACLPFEQRLGQGLDRVVGIDHVIAWMQIERPQFFLARGHRIGQ